MSSIQEQCRPRPLAENLRHTLRHHTFRRTLQLEIIGLFLVTLILVFGGVRRSITVSNRVLRELNSSLDAYSELLSRISNMNTLPHSNVSSLWRHDIMDDYYRTRFSTPLRGDLCLLDASGTPLLSSRENISEEELRDLRLIWQNISAADTSTAAITRGKDRSLLISLPVAANRGWVVLQFEESSFAPLFAAESVKTALSDSDGWALAPDQAAPLDALHQIHREFTSGTGLHIIPGAIYFSVCRPLDIAPLSLYTFWNLTPVLIPLGLIILSNLFMLGVMMKLSSKDTQAIAGEFTHDILLLKDALQEACEGNLDRTVSIDSSAELADIGKDYNHMLLSLKKQMADNEALAQVVADEQVKQLGSQFTAHFLFNTLDNIHYMCRSSPELAESMIISLSELLRYNTHGPNDKVTLAEDFHYIRTYLHILKIRFRDAFIFHINIEEGLEDNLVLKLLVQPILENSLKYGRANREILDIRVEAKHRGDHIALICRDNGEGIPEEQLAHIKRCLSAEENRGTHLGLYNLHRRIRLTYGDPYGIHLNNDNGLVVTVEIPTEKEYEE